MTKLYLDVNDNDFMNTLVDMKRSIEKKSGLSYETLLALHRANATTPRELENVWGRKCSL